MKTVGIIGAGAAGLCAIRHSLAQGLSPVAWEHGSAVGGTWNYTESVGKDAYGYPIYSSMYTNMRTNLPKEIMGYPDFPFPDEEESFVHHTSVLRYLGLYADKYNLIPHINFNHHVNLVEPIFHREEPPSWKVTVENLKTGETVNQVCDFLMVCNGHYSKPKLPHMAAMENFGGIKIHSHNYRTPAGYSGKKVAVLGAGPSGIDIALELCKVAENIYLCHNHPLPLPCKLPGNLFQRKGIIEARKDGFILKDKSFIEVDILLYCTGYEFDMPFLSTECKVKIENNQVKPLYKHVLHTDYPTIGFPGLVYQVLPFPLFDVQVRFLLSIFTDEVTSLTSSQMNIETNRAMMRFVYEGNNPKKYFHLFSSQENYAKDLLDRINQKHLPASSFKLLKITILRLLFDVNTFKRYRYVISDNSVKEILNGSEVATKWNLSAKVVSRFGIIFVTNFSDICLLIFGFVYRKVRVFIYDILSWLGAWDNYL